MDLQDGRTPGPLQHRRRPRRGRRVLPGCVELPGRRRRGRHHERRSTVPARALAHGAQRRRRAQHLLRAHAPLVRTGPVRPRPAPPAERGGHRGRRRAARRPGAADHRQQPRGRRCRPGLRRAAPDHVRGTAGPLVRLLDDAGDRPRAGVRPRGRPHDPPACRCLGAVARVRGRRPARVVHVPVLGTARRRAGRHDAHLAGHPSAAGRRPAGVRLLARRRRGRRGGRGPPRPDDVRTGLEAALLDRHEARAERPPGELRAGAAELRRLHPDGVRLRGADARGTGHRLRRPEPADPRRRRGDRPAGGRAADRRRHRRVGPVQPLYNSRYLTFTTPFVALLIAMGITVFRWRVVSLVAVVVGVALVAALAAPTWVQQRQALHKSGSHWAATVDYITRERAALPDVGADGVWYGPLPGHPIRTTEYVASSYPDAFAGMKDLTLVRSGASIGELWPSHAAAPPPQHGRGRPHLVRRRPDQQAAHDHAPPARGQPLARGDPQADPGLLRHHLRAQPASTRSLTTGPTTARTGGPVPADTGPPVRQVVLTTAPPAAAGRRRSRPRLRGRCGPRRRRAGSRLRPGRSRRSAGGRPLPARRRRTG